MQKLKHDLMNDIRLIGINELFHLSLKDYSKTCFGKYNPNTNTIILYLYSDKEHTKRVPYNELLLTFVHEAVHCKQWHDPNFKRLKGVMHDVEFKELYSKYSDKAKALLLFREVSSNEDQKEKRTN